MKSMFEKVAEFHAKNSIPTPERPELMPVDLFQYRVKFIQEELREFKNSHVDLDITNAARELADILYVTLGTALLMGLPMDKVFDLVHQANMEGRVRVTSAEHSAEETGRGHEYDCVKLPTFKSPNPAIAELLK